MKLAIMQPYLFPYLGYFQLIQAVDTFVIYDDVNYIKGGWINRNRILAQGRDQLFTLPLQNASPNRLINQLELAGDNRRGLLTTIRQSYSKAPQFPTIFPLIEEILLQPERNVAKFLAFSLKRVCEYLGLHPRWQISSSLNKDNALRGQEKVLAICHELGADHYINLPGGKELYDSDRFMGNGIRLSFIESQCTPYRQFANEFVPNLSIIDIMMFNDREQCSELLRRYELA